MMAQLQFIIVDDHKMLSAELSLCIQRNSWKNSGKPCGLGYCSSTRRKYVYSRKTCCRENLELLASEMLIAKSELFIKRQTYYLRNILAKFDRFD